VEGEEGAGGGRSNFLPLAMFPPPSFRLIRLSPTTRMASSNAPSVLRKQPPPPDSLNSLINSGWKLANNTSPEGKDAQRLTRDYKFKDFSEAWGFMSRVALASEKLNVRLPRFSHPGSPLPVGRIDDSLSM
jgi:hypothetical protein